MDEIGMYLVFFQDRLDFENSRTVSKVYRSEQSWLSRQSSSIKGNYLLGHIGAVHRIRICWIRNKNSPWIQIIVRIQNSGTNLQNINYIMGGGQILSFNGWKLSFRKIISETRKWIVYRILIKLVIGRTIKNSKNENLKSEPFYEK